MRDVPFKNSSSTDPRVLPYYRQDNLLTNVLPALYEHSFAKKLKTQAERNKNYDHKNPAHASWQEIFATLNEIDAAWKAIEDKKKEDIFAIIVKLVEQQKHTPLSVDGPIAVPFSLERKYAVHHHNNDYFVERMAIVGE